MCSSYLVAATAKKKQDAQLLIWLQEEVVEPTVFDEVRRSLEYLRRAALSTSWNSNGVSLGGLLKVL